jgi:hypothetical protein
MTSLLQKIKELVSSKQDLITETTEIEVFNITSNINFIDNIDPNNFNSISYTSLKYIEDSINSFVSQIGDLTTTKQDKLTAGDNITIDENNVISSTGGGGSSTAFPCCHYSRSGAVTYSVAFSTLIFVRQLFDYENAYNTTTGIYTIPLSGVYCFQLTVESVGNQRMDIYLYKNGGVVGGRLFTGVTTLGGNTTLNLCCIHDCNLNDEIKFVLHSGQCRLSSVNTGLSIHMVRAL